MAGSKHNYSAQKHKKLCLRIRQGIWMFLFDKTYTKRKIADMIRISPKTLRRYAKFALHNTPEAKMLGVDWGTNLNTHIPPWPSNGMLGEPRLRKLLVQDLQMVVRLHTTKWTNRLTWSAYKTKTEYY